MARQMRGECGHCHAQVTPGGGVRIGLFECNFCPRCAGSMQHGCSDFNGGVVRQVRPGPARTAGPATA
jgi:hypothetical protein